MLNAQNDLRPKLGAKNYLVMNIQPKIIDHLGINMYTNLHSIISEMVANAWDADARKVWVTVPEGMIGPNYEIKVKDDGLGMSFSDINDMYLQVGRNRREETQDARTPSGRRILARKGIGKFSVFGVAEKVIIRASKAQTATEFEMDIGSIKNVTSGQYKPHIIYNGPSQEHSGVTVTLKGLKRKQPIIIKLLREGIATRFLLIGKGFTIYLNDIAITEGDVKVEDIEYRWPINESVGRPEWRVKGEILAKKGTIRNVHARGVAFFARGKLVQEPTFFGATTGKEYAYDHLFGKLEADFLDDIHDVVATNRSSINEESEEGQALMKWAYKKFVDISQDWSKKRVSERTELVTNNESFADWFSELRPVEREMAQKVFNAITKNDNLSVDKIIQLASVVKDSFQYSAFQDLSAKIHDALPEQVPLIIELFRDWEYLEAREFHKVFLGRIETMNKMRLYIEQNVKEVPTMHEYLKKFPWILDPRWAVVFDEVRYSKLLKLNFPENDRPKEDKRIDFLCFSTWPVVIIVELKRPGKAVGIKDLEQLREYVLFLQEHLGSTDPDMGGKEVYGYLICEEEQKNKAYEIRKSNIAQQKMFVRKYADLLSMALQINDDIVSKYEEIRKITRPNPSANL